MSNSVNVVFLTVATGLVSLGATTIEHNLLAGAVEIILGIACFAVYEFTPTKS